MNRNKIFPSGFSNSMTEQEYCKKNENGNCIENQCGGCSFFAPLNSDYGLCCYKKSRFWLETIFEHFGCEKYVHEGWGVHSFDDDTFHLNKDDMLTLLIECEKAFSCNKTTLTKQNRYIHLKVRDFLLRYI